MPIRILPIDVANQIAAGEVVDRPASVVKELLENALDAGARDIAVTVEQGGRKRIAVTDDGVGMTREDALLAVKRHATSKIAAAADLWAIRSFGFRGEALPSIASVSRMTLVTRPAAQEIGTKLVIDGGAEVHVGEAGCAPGAVVTVDDLFFNTPARRKFLKTVRTELGHIVEVVTRIALARPDVGFHVSHDGGELFNSPGSNTLSERVKDILGRDAMTHMISMEYEAGPLIITGLLGVPGFTRSSRSAVYTYVNGRFVRDKVLSHAITAAYGHTLPAGRYPVVVVFLDMPPDQVDVNVHPAKSEVRFHASQSIHHAVERAIAETLAHDASSRHVVTAPPVHGETMHGEAASVPSASGAPRGSSQRSAPAAGRWASLAQFDASVRAASPSALSQEVAGGRRRGRCVGVQRRHRAGASVQPLDFGPGFFASLRVVGQLDSTYIVCEGDAGMILVDQHTAHERVGFEELRRSVEANAVPRQTLLFPEHIELAHADALHMEEHLDDFARLGLPVEHFGGTTFVVRAVPAMLTHAPPRELVLDVLDELSHGSRGAALERRLDDVLATMSCHSVVRAHRALRPDEITHLLAMLDQAECPQICPHGRPTALTFPFEQIEQMFGRR